MFKWIFKIFKTDSYLHELVGEYYDVLYDLIHYLEDDCSNYNFGELFKKAKTFLEDHE